MMAFFLKAGAIGLLATAAFPMVIAPLSPQPLLEFLPRELFMFVAVGWLYLELPKHHGWRRFLFFWTAGFFHFLGLIYWLVIAMTNFGGLPFVQSLFLLALLCLYCAVYWGLLPVLSDFLCRHIRMPLFLAFPCSVVLLEWLRTIVITGFPWGLWGYSQTRNILFLQLASVVGVYGVSWMIALVAALAGECVKAEDKIRRRMNFIRLAGALLCIYGMGGILFLSSEMPAGEKLRVGLIQGNIEQTLKSRSSEYRRQIREKYMKLSRTAFDAGASLIVWPEAAWPGHVRAESKALRGFDLAGDTIMGASTYLKEGKGKHKLHNSAFYFREKEIVGRYDKLHLVPFGEYVPLRGILPVEKFVPGMADYSPGHSHAPLANQWGVLICYDGIFPEISREHVLAGATLLANLTNDAWYGVSSAPYQHRDFYALRAVETGRWLVRTANTGISVFFDPKGRMFAPTPHNQDAVTLYDVVPYGGQTFYVLLGNWVIAVCIGFFLIAFVYALRQRLGRG